MVHLDEDELDLCNEKFLFVFFVKISYLNGFFYAKR